MTVGSLFAGIGGFDLGFERAGFEIKWQVEIDDYAQRVLTKHWPGVRRYGDIRAIDWRAVEPVDVICGGFPCQPHSTAGRRLASADERDLWSEFARAIRGVRPRWIVAENVPGLLSSESGRFFGRILRDLAQSGYDAEWDCIPAVAFGAPHRRDRVWLVAYAEHLGWDAGPNSDATARQGSDGTLGRNTQHRQSSRCGDVADTTGNRLDRSTDAGVCDPKTLGESARSSSWRSSTAVYSSDRALADSDDGGRKGVGLAEHGNEQGTSWREPNGCRERRWWNGTALDIAHSARRQHSSESHERARIFRNGQRVDAAIASAGWWDVEPDVGRVAHGIPAQVDRLRGLGNAIVPQIAQWIAERIKEAERVNGNSCHE